MSWLSRKSVGFTGLLVAAAATVMFLSLSIMAPADQSSPSDQAAGAGDEGSNTEEVLTSPASTPPESLSLAGSDPVPQPQGPTSVASPTSASPTPVEAPVAPEGLSGAFGSKGARRSAISTWRT